MESTLQIIDSNLFRCGCPLPYKFQLSWSIGLYLLTPKNAIYFLSLLLFFPFRYTFVFNFFKMTLPW